MTRYPGNIEHQIEVFKSPENYGERFRGSLDVPISVAPASMYCHEVVEGGPIEPLTVNRLILTRHRCSIHVSQALLDQYCPNLNFRGLSLRESRQEDLDMHQAWVVAVMRKTAEATYQKLKEETWDNEHNVLIDSVKVVWQYEYDRILVDMRIYACRHREVDLAQQRFQQALINLLQNSITLDGHTNEVRIENSALTAADMERVFRQMHQCRISWEHTNFTGPIGKKYDDKAEERALKLLKSMLSNDKFKLYLTEGYVVIKGTKNKMYKVKKNAMIEVSEKRKNNWYKAYEICIEPKHYGTICPTDAVIAKIKLIQSDEKKLHKIGNKFKDNSYNNRVLGYCYGIGAYTQ